jgi:multidrug efflux pump
LILTLFVIPAMYTFLSRQRKHVDFGEETPKQRELVYEA